MNRIRLVDKYLAAFEGLLIVIFLSLMVLFTFCQVLLRGLNLYAQIQWASDLMARVDWTEPFARLLILWITFLGASILTRDRRHIKIDILSPILPTRWQSYRELILSIATSIIMALMFHASIVYIRMEFSFGDTLFLSIPSWIGQIILPIGFLSIFFRFFLRALEEALTIFRKEPK